MELSESHSNFQELIEGEVICESFEEYRSEKDFTSLTCWKKCQNVKLFTYKHIISEIPKFEKENLGEQIRKAAVSCTANIAEGYGRFHYQEGLQFYRIARGSLYELKDHLISCRDLQLIQTDTFDKGIEKIEEAKKVLNGYIRFVKDKTKKD